MQRVCRGVRGATTVDSNDREAILEATRDLLRRMIVVNGIRPEDVAGVIFSTTPDLNAEFPAVAARQLGWHDVALLCTHEMNVPGALQRCIRILILWNTDRAQDEIHHVYIRGARHLRPDRAVELTVPLPAEEELDAAPIGPLVLALDAHPAGYTSTIVATNGEILTHHRSTDSLFSSGRLVLSRLYDALDAALLEARPRPLRPRSIGAVALSLDTEEDDLVRDALYDRYGWREQVYIVDRLTAAWAAAGSPAPAVVLLAETDWKAAGVEPGRQVNRASFLGSQGSVTLDNRPTTTWLGRRAFEAALLSQFGGPSTALYDALRARTHAESADELVRWGTDHAGPAFWASLALAVVEAADHGDSLAHRLLGEAGAALGEAALFVAGALSLPLSDLAVVVAGLPPLLHPAVLEAAHRTVVEGIGRPISLVPVHRPEEGTVRLALQALGVPDVAARRVLAAVHALSHDVGKRTEGQLP